MMIHPIVGARSSYLDYVARVLDSDGSHARKAERAKGCHRASLSILNEANLTVSENVGGQVDARPDAPEVASDDDGGEDADPEPERTSRHPIGSTLPPRIEHFDRLPDSACIDIATLKAITGKSRATLYRWIEKGILPKPRKLGLTNNVWAAGDVRRALKA